MQRSSSALLPLEVDILTAVIACREQAEPFWPRRFALERWGAPPAMAPRSFSNLYRTLERLQRLGLLRTWSEDPSALRGHGHPRKYYDVTPAGEAALAHALAHPGQVATRMYRNNGNAPTR